MCGAKGSNIMKNWARAAIAVTMIGITTPATAVECLVPGNPGGGWDFTCRQIGRIMQEIGLVQNAVQVSNLAGAGGGIGYNQVVNERNDDPDLFVAASSATSTRLAQNAFGGSTADQVRWVGTIAGDPGVIVVASDSKFKSLNDLVEAIKADPKSVTFSGGSAVGGFDHLKVLALLNKAGFKDIRAVKYIGLNSGTDAITQTIGGFTQAMTGDISEITGFIKSGDVRALAVLTDERVPGFEDIPTAKEQGFDSVAVNWRGVYVPKDISDDDYAKWVDWLKQVGASEQWKQVMKNNGLAPYSIFGADFEAFIDDNIKQAKDLSTEIGLLK